jgi:hypothetical protein
MPILKNHEEALVFFGITFEEIQVEAFHVSQERARGEWHAPASEDWFEAQRRLLERVGFSLKVMAA